jgi:hypothetical protein
MKGGKYILFIQHRTKITIVMITPGGHDHDGSTNNSRQRYFEGEHNHKGSMGNNSTMMPSNHDYERSNNNRDGAN